MNKTIKIQIIPEDMEELSFKNFYKLLFDLQNEARQIANRAIQLCWEFTNFECNYQKRTGKYPDKETKIQIMGYPAASSYAYSILSKESYNIGSHCMAEIIMKACAIFQSRKSSILKGIDSIPFYKDGMPINLPKRTIKIKKSENNLWECVLSILSAKCSQRLELKNCKLSFKMLVKDKYTGTILDCCNDGTHSITGSQLKYKDGKWFLHLGYFFEVSPVKELSENNICGVFVGKKSTVCATTNINNENLIISSAEIEQFKNQIKSRKKQLQKSSSICGNGRIGHGYYTRMKPIEKINDSISNFTNTMNHKYSKAIVEFAIKNNCGIIKIEDSATISDKNKILNNWAYSDLQQKIEYKANEAGIAILKVQSDLIRNICNKCGCGLEEGSDTLICNSCNCKINIDDNASKNLLK